MVKNAKNAFNVKTLRFERKKGYMVLNLFINNIYIAKY
jgi:hypothetical protein